MGEFADMAIEAGIDDWIDGDGGYYAYTTKNNPLHYHESYMDITVVTETDKACLIKFNDGDTCWVAKSLCKKLTDNSVYIHESVTLTPIDDIDIQPIGESNEN